MPSTCQVSFLLQSYQTLLYKNRFADIMQIAMKSLQLTLTPSLPGTKCWILPLILTPAI